MNAVLFVKYKLRALLGIRRQRQVPRPGRKPRIGVGIVCDDVRMIVPAGMSDELWDWLVERGWREVIYRPDHRVYRQAPVSCVRALIEAEESWREAKLQDAIDRAELRNCALSDPDALPSYIERR